MKFYQKPPIVSCAHPGLRSRYAVHCLVLECCLPLSPVVFGPICGRFVGPGVLYPVVSRCLPGHAADFLVLECWSPVVPLTSLFGGTRRYNLILYIWDHDVFVRVLLLLLQSV